jgi:hypothetical protein
MKTKTLTNYWNAANLIMLGGGLLMTWLIYGFEPPPFATPVSGWEHIINQITASLSLLSEYGFAWVWLLSLLQGICGVLVAIYVIIKIGNVMKSGSFTPSKFSSAILFLSLLIFLLEDFVFSFRGIPHPGYWIFMIGLVSSMIFEWQNVGFN